MFSACLFGLNLPQILPVFKAKMNAELSSLGFGTFSALSFIFLYLDYSCSSFRIPALEVISSMKPSLTCHTDRQAGMITTNLVTKMVTTKPEYCIYANIILEVLLASLSLHETQRSLRLGALLLNFLCLTKILTDIRHSEIFNWMNGLKLLGKMLRRKEEFKIHLGGISKGKMEWRGPSNNFCLQQSLLHANTLNGQYQKELFITKHVPI